MNEQSRGPIQTAMPSWLKTIAAYQEWLDKVVNEFHIDELALLFNRDPINWLRSAVSEPGVKLFNTAYDHVHTEPIATTYDVMYDFLEVADQHDLRIECMHFPEMSRSMSPLHTPLMVNLYESGQPCVVVHLSFKVPDPSDYDDVLTALEDNATLAMSCESTYGRFAYFKVEELWENQAALYLKPRTNLRDGVPDEEFVEVSEPGERGAFGHPTIGGGVAAGPYDTPSTPPYGDGPRPIKDTPQA